MPNFWNKEGHLNDSGLSLYVEARLLEREEELPEKIRSHVDQCPLCQQNILEFYEFMQDEELENLQPHPYLDRKPALKVWRNLKNLSSKFGRVAVVILLTVVSSLAYLLVQPSSEVPKSFVRSPFQNASIDVPYLEWKLQAQKSYSLDLNNGSYLFLPAQAFLDEEGQVVSGEIVLRFREMNNAADLIASGIPHFLETEEGKQMLESAGAFEIRAFQNGERLLLAPGSQITVNLASRFSEEDFQHYYLREAQTNSNSSISSPLAYVLYAQEEKPGWEYLGPSRIQYASNLAYQTKSRLEQKTQELDSLANTIRELQEKLQSQEPYISQKKLSLNSAQDNFFKLSFNTKDNPDLKKFEDRVWSYAGENKSQSPTQDQQWLLQESWDEVDLKVLKYRPLSLKGHMGAVNDAQFSPDGQKIVTASEDFSARVWSSEAQYLFTLNGHRAPVNTACFSPGDAEYILTASDDQSAKIWTHQGQLITTLSGHQKGLHSALFSANAQHILTSSQDNTAKLWNSRGQILNTFLHKNDVEAAHFSPNGKYFVTIPNSEEARIWSVDGKNMAILEGNFNSAQFSNNGKYILTTSRNVFSGSAKLWDIRGKLLRELSLNDEYIRFSPNDKYILSVSGNGARLWYLNPAKAYGTILIRNMKNLPNEYREAHEDKINSLSYSQDQRLILSASSDQTLKIWDREGKVLHTLREHTGKINKAVFSPDNQKILSASDDYTAKLWVEREIQDVMEMALTKKRRSIKDEKGNILDIEGKQAFTIVRQVKANEIHDTEKIKRAKPQENPLNSILAKYENLAREVKMLKAQKIPDGSVLLRRFEVYRLGYYACQRPYQSEQSIACKANFKFKKEVDPEELHLYLITGDYETVVIPLDYRVEGSTQVQLDLHKPNKILAIFPRDRLAMFGKDKFNQINPLILRSSGQYQFDLRRSFPIKNKKEFDSFFLHFGT